MKGRTGGLESEGSPEGFGLPSLTGCSARSFRTSIDKVHRLDWRDSGLLQFPGVDFLMTTRRRVDPANGLPDRPETI